jgi:hypothetical protein
MSEQKPEHEETRSEESDEKQLQDLDVSEEDAEDVKGGQEMPPFPRQQR